MRARVPKDLISPGKACKLLQVSVRTVNRWIASGRLRAWRLRGSKRRRRVSEAEVRRLGEVVPAK